MSHFTLLSAALIPVLGVSAYSFEKDGIYYNKTTGNTLEVTFKDNKYASYSGNLVIRTTAAAMLRHLQFPMV
ncbi:hypothetical protein [uncultured Muribaculum sp.]|uniref:hypothetical protein n=1 Tax=uncultured Muribaculum sp. TaxID=1918613 RepID=UPI002627C6CD|nr:hypothetical protein [uncultured Muribaculum sp.]